MNIIYVILLVLWIPMIGVASSANAPKSFVARVTYYNGREDSYGKKTVVRGVYATHGRTVASDLRLFGLGVKLRIKELNGVVGKGEFRVEDTGTAVIKRTASKKMARYMLRHGEISKREYETLKNAPVIDVFVDLSHREMERLANRMPYFVTVEIVQS